MEDRIINRRQAAQSRKIAVIHQSRRKDLTDPLFNLRECVKQMLLLEDHLSHPYKICPDCVRKHLLTIEALAEEASAMDQSGEHVGLSEAMAEESRQWLESITDSTDTKQVANDIRVLRKKLMPLVFDPRQAAMRVASLHVQRGQCRHQF